MLLKGLIHQNEAETTVPGEHRKQYQNRLFEIFGKEMIIESVLHVEDTVKVIVTQIIAGFLDLYFRHDYQHKN